MGRGPRSGNCIPAINTSQARHVWLPIRFQGERPVIEWRAEWSLDEFE